jgi:hypothetical protein
MLRHTTAIALSLFIGNFAAAQQPLNGSPYWNNQPGVYPAYPYSTPNYWNGSVSGSCPGGVCNGTCPGNCPSGSCNGACQGNCPGGTCSNGPTICGPNGCYQSPVQTLPYSNYPRVTAPRVRYPYTNQNGVFPYSPYTGPVQRPNYYSAPGYTPVYTQPGSSYPGYPGIPTYNPQLLSDADYGGGVLH